MSPKGAITRLHYDNGGAHAASLRLTAGLVGHRDKCRLEAFAIRLEAIATRAKTCKNAIQLLVIISQLSDFSGHQS